MHFFVEGKPVGVVEATIKSRMNLEKIAILMLPLGLSVASGMSNSKYDSFVVGMVIHSVLMKELIHLHWSIT